MIMSDGSFNNTDDFSLAMPELIAKTRAIAQSLAFAGQLKDGETFTNEEIYGFSEILFEIGRDLEVINNKLYPRSDPVGENG